MKPNDLKELLQTVANKAVKEFAEKLRERMELEGYRSPLHNRIIDELVKEYDK